jgi:hypothetical protein
MEVIRAISSGRRISLAVSAAQKLSEDQQAEPQQPAPAQSQWNAGWETRAKLPIVPLEWVRGLTRITPDDVGEARVGRPRLIMTRRELSMHDMESNIQYLQRRHRELSKIVKDTQPTSEHTTKIIRSAIKDAIRKLSMSLPEANREQIDSAVAGL